MEDVLNKSEIDALNQAIDNNTDLIERNNPEIEVTHKHLNDQTVMGLKMKNKNCFSVQYHPEAGPGPNDATYLFDEFVDRMSQVSV